MSSTISAAAAATHVPTNRAPPPESAAQANAGAGKSAAQFSTAAVTASRGQQQAALNRLLAKYTYDQSSGADANVLSALGKQIATAAKALGQHVTLPRPSTGPAMGAAIVAGRSAPSAGKVNVTA